MGELRETINELFNLQGNKLFRTIKGLTVAPGNTIRTFAEGDRTTFLHPFTYALTFIGLMVFLLSMFNSELEFTEEKRLERQEAIENLSQKESLTDKEKGVLKFNQLWLWPWVLLWQRLRPRMHLAGQLKYKKMNHREVDVQAIGCFWK